MTPQEKSSRYLELMKDAGFVEKLLATGTIEEAQALFVKNDLDVSIDETAEIAAAMVSASGGPAQDTDALTEDALESVVGGLSLFNVARKTWNWGTKIAGLYWGSQEKAKKATLSFWGNVVTKGWDYAAKNVGSY